MLVRVIVDPDACIGSAECVALDPETVELGRARHRATARSRARRRARQAALRRLPYRGALDRSVATARSTAHVPSWRTDWRAAPGHSPEYVHLQEPLAERTRLPKPRALVRFRPGASRWCASASGDARIPTHFRLRPASSLPIHPHQIVCREFRRASPSTHALPPHRLRSAASASCDSASVIAAASISSLPCQRTAVGSSFSGFTSASRSR